MKVKEAVSEIEKCARNLKSKEDFNVILFLFNQLFSSFWAYQEKIPSGIFNLVEQLSDFSYKFERKKINFEELREKDIEVVQRKFLLFVGFFKKFLRDFPQIEDLEIVSEKDLNKSLRSFRILIVCVGNVSRSPAIEKSLHFIKEKLGFDILEAKSCGVFNLMGFSQEEKVHRPLLRRLIDKIIKGGSKPINEKLVNWSDIILTAVPYVSKEIIKEFPHSKEKVLTAKEFVSDYRISEQGFFYGFYIDDPTFATQREKAVVEFLEKTAWKGDINAFLAQADKEIQEGKRKPFLYRGKHAEMSLKSESIAVRELLRLAFAIVEKGIKDNFLISKPEYRSILLYKLMNLKQKAL